MILLTGFEPFGGESTNPSWDAASRAAANLADLGLAATAVELPCTFDGSLTRLSEAIRDTSPRLVICVGQAGGRSRISLERVAINCDDARIPDNAGQQPVDQAIAAAGPAAYFSTLPIKAGLAALQELDIPADISQTAGTYVCNHVFYGLMHLLQSHPGIRGGFVHVPYSPAQAEVHDAPSLPVDMMAAALVAVARTALATHDDVELAAGAEH